MTELVVVWNGAHLGIDADLLCEGIRVRDTFISEAVPMVAPPTQERLAVFDVLPTRKAEAVTIQQIMARSGASYGSASHTLFRLRQRGLLQSTLVQGPVGSGQRPRLYWRVARPLEIER